MGAARVIAAGLTLLVLTGCVTTGGLCSLGPMIPDPGATDRWTSNEKRQLVDRNDTGVKECGWERPA
jgi:hypothetical protein